VTLLLGNGLSPRNVAGQFDVKRFDDNVHVLVRIIFFKVVPDLRCHIVFPKGQNLPLVTRECLQHFARNGTAVQNVFHFPGLQRQTFDHREFQACRCAAVTDGGDFRYINGMLPLRAVVGLNDAA
jgi:hypothetical protein